MFYVEHSAFPPDSRIWATSLASPSQGSSGLRDQWSPATGFATMAVDHSRGAPARVGKSPAGTAIDTQEQPATSIVISSPPLAPETHPERPARDSSPHSRPWPAPGSPQGPAPPPGSVPVRMVAQTSLRGPRTDRGLPGGRANEFERDFETDFVGNSGASENSGTRKTTGPRTRSVPTPTQDEQIGLFSSGVAMATPHPTSAIH
jgi:hypothetical protein